MKRTRLSKRATARLAEMRRDPFGRLSLEVGRYLETVGWRAVVIGPARVQSGVAPLIDSDDAGIGRYEFVVRFTGGKIRETSTKAARVRT